MTQPSPAVQIWLHQDMGAEYEHLNGADCPCVPEAMSAGLSTLDVHVAREESA